MAKNIPARGNRYSAEFREAVITDTIKRLASGETTDAIGKSHGVSGIGIRKWLIADPRADEARAEYLSGELVQAYDEIRAADDVLSLARARERFKSAAWLAERRLPALFGPQSHVTLDVAMDLGERLRRSRARVIDNNG